MCAFFEPLMVVSWTHTETMCKAAVTQNIVCSCQVFSNLALEMVLANLRVNIGNTMMVD